MRERFFVSLTRALVLVSFFFDVANLILLRAGIADLELPFWPAFSPAWLGAGEWAQPVVWGGLVWLLVKPLSPLKLFDRAPPASDKREASFQGVLRVLLRVCAVLGPATLVLRLVSSSASVVGVTLHAGRASVMALTALLLALRIQPESLSQALASAVAKEPSPPLRPPLVEKPAPLPPAVPAPLPASVAPGVCVDCGAVVAGWSCARCGAIQSLDTHTVRRVLAHRPHGRTYLAEGADGTNVVIKELILPRASDVGAVDAFEREARLLAGLRHPRLPRFIARQHRTDESGALRLFTVMGYLEGVTLEHLAARGELSAESLIGFVRQGLDLLVYLQSREQPVLHRDLKPSNLLVSPDGKLNLVDFGVARQTQGGGSEGTLVGTVGFIPPEQLAGRVDRRSDPYALAMTVICLLTGRDPVDLMTETGAVRVPPLPIEPRLAKVLRRMVAREPEARYRDARAARAALDSQPSLSPIGWVAAGAATLLLAAGLVRWARAPRSANAAAAVAATPVKVAPAGVATPSADVRVLARWEGGQVTSADFQAELDRLPPILRDTYPDWRADLVKSLAVQFQLEQVALARGLNGVDRFARMRALIATPSEPEARRTAFDALVAETRSAELLNAELLKALRPSRLADVYAPGSWRPHAFWVWLAPFVTLEGWQSGDGTFELSWADGPAGSFDSTRTMPPLDWLYIDLVEPGLTGGNYLMHSLPNAIVAAGGANTWKALPPSPPSPEELATRYAVKRVASQLRGLTSEDVAVVWERVDAAVSRCLMLTAWDSRVEHATVRFSVWVTDGQMKASVPKFSEVARGKVEDNLAFVQLDNGLGCGDLISRWRFPREVSGSASLILQLSGTTWTDEEQALGRAR